MHFYIFAFLNFYIFTLLLVVLLVGKPDEHRTKHCEDVCLNKSNQQLQQIHEEQHDDAKGIQAKTKSDTHRPTEEDHTRDGSSARKAS